MRTILCMLLAGYVGGISTMVLAANGDKTFNTSAIAKKLILETKWSVNDVGTEQYLDFTLNNPTAYHLKDIRIHCSYVAASGTLLGQEDHTIYELLAPHSTQSFQYSPIEGIPRQTKGMSCTIQGLEVAQ